MMKKNLCLLLAAALLLAALAGCGGNAGVQPGDNAAPAGERADTEPPTPPDAAADGDALVQGLADGRDNEILTYDRVDPDKTTLVVSMLGDNDKIKRLSAAFEQQNPDVQVVCIDITGGDGAYLPTDDWVRHGMAPDLMFSNDRLLKAAGETEKYMTDLSAHPVLSRFEVDSLDRLSVDGHVYYLPGPSEVNCLCYNKALFETYGWQPPRTFDEFMALCAQITEDTDGQVQPWNPNAKYDNVFATALIGFTYGELFAGMDNAAWYADYCAGEAAFAGHMEPMYEMIQTLADAGLLREEFFTYSATTRGIEFQEGKIAMVNNDASTFFDANDSGDIGYIPFPSTDGRQGYVSTAYSMVLCEPVKAHTQAQQDAIDRYIAFYASVEGQQIIIADSLLISNVKDMPAAGREILADVTAAVAQGYQFASFVLGGQTRYCSLRDNAAAIAVDNMTAAEVMAQVDSKPVTDITTNTQQSRTAIATVAEGGLTILEFSCYIADMYRETAGADIGLINHGVAFRGNLVRLFAGEMYDTYVRVLKPRSFDNGAALIKVSMTGKQLRDALNHPYRPGEGSSDSVYAFSGLACTLAPWNAAGEKVLSVTMADGAPLEDDTLYTVAVWAGTVADAYITEVLASYEGSWEELMTAKMKSDGTIAPANDGRFTLVWD